MILSKERIGEECFLNGCDCDLQEIESIMTEGLCETIELLGQKIKDQEDVIEALSAQISVIGDETLETMSLVTKTLIKLSSKITMLSEELGYGFEAIPATKESIKLVKNKNK